MTAIVTLDETKAYLRVIADDDDETISALIDAATEAVLAIADGWDGVAPAPSRLKLAVLARVANTFDDRGNLRGGDGEDRLLNPLREVWI